MFKVQVLHFTSLATASAHFPYTSTLFYIMTLGGTLNSRWL